MKFIDESLTILGLSVSSSPAIFGEIVHKLVRSFVESNVQERITLKIRFFLATSFTEEHTVCTVRIILAWSSLSVLLTELAEHC